MEGKRPQTTIFKDSLHPVVSIVCLGTALCLVMLFICDKGISGPGKSNQTEEKSLDHRP